MISFLYSFEFPNGKFYYGISTNPGTRWLSHRNASVKGSSNPVHRAIRKYGFDKVKKSILVKGELEYIKMLEINAIKTYSSQTPNGYNVSHGGDMSPMLVKETRDKVSKTMSVKYSSERNPFYGRRHSDDSKKKISQANLGFKHSIDSKEKIRSALKGRKDSELQIAEKKIRMNKFWNSENGNLQKAKHSEFMSSNNPAIIHRETNSFVINNPGKSEESILRMKINNPMKSEEQVLKRKELFELKRAWAEKVGYTGNRTKITKQMIENFKIDDED